MSLRELGDLSGIVYSKRGGYIIAGHQRVTALVAEYGDKLEMIGGDDAPAIKTPDGKIFPVRIVDISPDMERLANVTANNPHIQGVFDENLEDILGQIGNDFADGLAEDLRIPDLDLDMVIGKTGTGAPGKEGASPAVKPGRPPAPEIQGDDDRSGRFLLVYTSPEEKAYWCDLLGLPEETDRVVITVDEMKEHQEAEEGEQEPGTEAEEGDANEGK